MAQGIELGHRHLALQDRFGAVRQTFRDNAITALLLRQNSSATVYRLKEQARYLEAPARRRLWIAPGAAPTFLAAIRAAGDASLILSIFQERSGS
jgi:hypothetical protein